MAWDFKFDPVTRDLIRTANGSVETTQTAETMVMHQIAIHYRSWPGGPELGSTLHDLRAFGARPEIAVPAEHRRALEVVAARGRIDNIQIGDAEVSRGRIVTRAEFRDVRTGQIIKTGA